LYIYGTDKKFIEQLYKEDSSLKELLHPRLPYTKAEVVFAVRNEMARTLEDVLARRVRVLFLDASAAIDIAEEVAQIIGRELKKDTDWEAAQVASFKVLAQQYLLK
jgi:glycerol-3-phosphate dehydrogenase